MEQFEAKNYRDNLAKELKEKREGGLKDKIVDFFSSKEKVQERLAKRKEIARKYLDSIQKNKISDQYIDEKGTYVLEFNPGYDPDSKYKRAKNVVHPEILIKKQEELRKQMREKFATEFNGFEDILENNEIVDELIALNIEKISKITEKQMDFIPEHHALITYTQDGDWVGGFGGGTSASILTLDDSNKENCIAVPQKRYEAEGDAYCDYVYKEEQLISEGQAVKEVIPKDKNSITIITDSANETYGFVFVDRNTKKREAYLYNGKDYQ